MKKEHKIRLKYISEIKTFTDIKKDFRVKSRYIDLNIQNDIKYFNSNKAFREKTESRKELQKAFDRNYKQ